MFEEIPFEIALIPDLELVSRTCGSALRLEAPHQREGSREVELSSGSDRMLSAVDRLRSGVPARQLLFDVARSQGQLAAAELTADLVRLNQQGWIIYRCAGLAKALPIAARPELRGWEVRSGGRAVRMSRFAYLRADRGHTVIESPLSKFRIVVIGNQVGALIAGLAEPIDDDRLPAVPGLKTEAVETLVSLLAMTGFLEVETPSRSLQLWEFHSLLFHGYSRFGRHDFPSLRGLDELDPEDNRRFPALRAPVREHAITLVRPDLDELAARDAPFSRVMEARRTFRTHDDKRPISLEQLGEFLYRAARITGTFQVDHHAIPDQLDRAPDDAGEIISEFARLDMLTDRAYPAGGGLYELEIYPLVRLCKGLDAGLYRYDPLEHQLEHLEVDSREAEALVRGYHQFMVGADGPPQICLLITARFGRVFKKYRNVGYSLILKHVGVLYQSFYLTATSMGLAPCAIGGGDAEAFARMSGLPFEEESTVGEFMLGSRGPVSEFPPRLHPRAQPPVLPRGRSEAPTVGASPVVETGISTGHSMSSTSAASRAQEGVAPPTGIHVHDLDQRVPGLQELRTATLGDPDVTVVILDGDPDTSVGCLRNPMLSKVVPYWHATPRRIDRSVYARYREISARDAPGVERARALQAELDDATLAQLGFNTHATAVTSIIAGLPGSAVPGLAPRCRVINVPIVDDGDAGELMSSLNLARALELALRLDADVIHCAVCQPTRSGSIDSLLARTLESCRQRGVAIVAPAGNDRGECVCIPAIAPGVLAVGASTGDGHPAPYSNWGSEYEGRGILAPGTDVLCAQPGTDEVDRREGTSLAAPVVTGVLALLLSWSRSLGRNGNGQTIVAAVQETALACDLEDAAEPTRCLGGVLHLPGAAERLSGSRVRPSSEPDLAPRSGSISAQAQGRRAAQVVNGAYSSNVYALGRIGVDLPTDSARDELAARMAASPTTGQRSDPTNRADIVTHLKEVPDDADRLTWTLDGDGGPRFALQPTGAGARDIFDAFVGGLEGQLEPVDSAEHVERISIPGRTTGRFRKLSSGQSVPEIEVRDLRGLYAWSVQTLIEHALDGVSSDLGERGLTRLRRALTTFLNRVYNDLGNLGESSRDRAMNFAATNIYQAVEVFEDALRGGRELNTIKVQKSLFCRMHSDCWDVRLSFVDVENQRRAAKVFVFTVDVSDTLPVTLGTIKSWSEPDSQLLLYE